MSWVYDAPQGVYRNHSLTNKIRREAMAKTVFMKYLNPEPGFGKRKGESQTITRIMRLPLADRVGETDRLPGGRPPIQTKTVKISEWGFKVPMTQSETDLTYYDLPANVESVLRDQIEMTMDIMAADAFKLTQLKYTPTSSGFNIETDGTPSGTADRNLQVADLRELHDYLSGTLKCPPMANGKYVGILSTRAARGIKNDPEYKDWIAPTSSEPLMNGVLKDIEGFTLIETNNYGYERDALANLAGASTVLGEAVFFGGDAAGLLEIQAPEIRMGVKEDLGRFYDIGWVGKCESFLTWEQPSQSRVIHVTSE